MTRSAHHAATPNNPVTKSDCNTECDTRKSVLERIRARHEATRSPKERDNNRDTSEQRGGSPLRPLRTAVLLLIALHRLVEEALPIIAHVFGEGLGELLLLGNALSPELLPRRRSGALATKDARKPLERGVRNLGHALSQPSLSGTSRGNAARAAGRDGCILPQDTRLREVLVG
jgi:hypothetical protein